MSRNKKNLKGYQDDGFVVEDTSEIEIFVQSDDSAANSNRSTSRGSHSSGSSVATALQDEDFFVADHRLEAPPSSTARRLFLDDEAPVAKERRKETPAASPNPPTPQKKSKVKVHRHDVAVLRTPSPLPKKKKTATYHEKNISELCTARQDRNAFEAENVDLRAQLQHSEYNNLLLKKRIRHLEIKYTSARKAIVPPSPVDIKKKTSKKVVGRKKLRRNSGPGQLVDLQGQQVNKLDPQLRETLRKLWERDYFASKQEAARQLNINVLTWSKLVTIDNPDVVKPHRVKRSELTTRIVLQALKDLRGRATTSQLKAKILESAAITVSRRYIRRLLHANRLVYAKPRKVPALTDAHRAARLAFAQRVVALDGDLSRWCFSDEKYFVLNNNAPSMWMSQEDRASYTCSTVAHPPKVMLWLAIGHFVAGDITSRGFWYGKAACQTAELYVTTLKMAFEPVSGSRVGAKTPLFLIPPSNYFQYPFK